MCCLRFLFCICIVLTDEGKGVVFSFSQEPIIVCLKQLSARLPLVTRFSALAAGYLLFPAWHWLYVFPRLPLVSIHDFPRFALVTCFRALASWFHVFARLLLVSLFSGLATGYLFFRACSGHVTCFPSRFVIGLCYDSQRKSALFAM